MNIGKELVTVIDSAPGYGKTTWAFENIRRDTSGSSLYITPFLSEVDRACSTIPRFRKPTFAKDGSKLTDLKNLLGRGDDIASTHSMFYRLDDEAKELIHQADYTLYLDETISAVEPYELAEKDSLQLLLDAGVLEIESDGLIRWIKDEIADTRYSDLMRLAKNECLYQISGGILMWRYPPALFRIFKKIYILTYNFHASTMRLYFDAFGIGYERKSIRQSETAWYSYELCDYYPTDKTEYRKKINVYGNEIFRGKHEQKKTELSVNWYKHADPYNLKNLKCKTENFFRHKMHADGKDVLWTTFAEYQGKLKGRGYTRYRNERGDWQSCFLPFNSRATNDYLNSHILAYLVNVYHNPNVLKFFATRGIKIDDYLKDEFATSELIQWIFRSAIRKGDEIHIYIPSNRMRTLLMDWLKN